MKKHFFSLMLTIILIILTVIPVSAANTSASKGIMYGKMMVTADGTLLRMEPDGKPHTKIMSGVASIVDIGTDYAILKNGDLYRLHDMEGLGKKGVVAKDVVSATAYYDSTLYIVKKDGSLMVQRTNATPIKMMDNVVDISISRGSWGIFALQKDGSLWAWGMNYLGQLGNGKKGEDVDKPVKIMDNVMSFSVDALRGFAVTKDGTLWSWGTAKSWNNDQPYENGVENETRSKPFEMMKDVKSVLVFNNDKYIIKTDNSLWAWNGSKNDYGVPPIVGNGKAGPVSKPVKIADNVLFVTRQAFIKTDGSVWAWGRNNYTITVGVNGTTKTSTVSGGVGSGSKETDVLKPERVNGIKYK